ncbi:unnamed protein product [Macrosiphum euphorbiae]|nr:unnamed protein product [Macrosiphum euphorbiae]
MKTKNSNDDFSSLIIVYEHEERLGEKSFPGILRTTGTTRVKIIQHCAVIQSEMNAPQSGGAERLIVNARHLEPQENRRPRGPGKKIISVRRGGGGFPGQAPPSGRPPPRVTVTGPRYRRRARDRDGTT